MIDYFFSALTSQPDFVHNSDFVDEMPADQSSVTELPVLNASELEGLDSEAIKRDVNLIEAEKNK